MDKDAVAFLSFVSVAASQFKGPAFNGRDYVFSFKNVLPLTNVQTRRYNVGNTTAVPFQLTQTQSGSSVDDDLTFDGHHYWRLNGGNVLQTIWDGKTYKNIQSWAASGTAQKGICFDGQNLLILSAT